jgi:hypothetical protein
MQTSWEALTAIASLLSSLAVLAAVLVAVRQVRVGAAQVEHLRRATQLEGTMKIFDQLRAPEQQAARSYILNELAAELADPARLPQLHAKWLASAEPSAEERKWLPALTLMEMNGIYVKHGLLDADIVFDYWVPALSRIWELLESHGVIALHRRAFGPEMWENYEYLYRRYEDWYMKRHGVPSASDWHPLHAEAQAAAGAASERAS